MVRIKAGVLERGAHLLLQTWWVVAVVRTDAPQHGWLWLCQLQGALNLQNQKICKCREQQRKFHCCCRDIVWASLPCPDILGREASDEQTEVAHCSCHSCPEFGVAAPRLPAHCVDVECCCSTHTHPSSTQGLQQQPGCCCRASAFSLHQLCTNFCW